MGHGLWCDRSCDTPVYTDERGHGPIDIRTALTTLLPADELATLARRTGFVERRRKLDPVAMFWTLALGFGAGTEQGFASLRQLHGCMSDTSLAPSSFHARFDASLVRFLRAVLVLLIERLAARPTMCPGTDLLTRFKDIVATDASVITRVRQLAT